VDPVLSYSTYLGPSDTYSYAIAVDTAGDAYIGGFTSSTKFPTQSPFQSTLKSSYDAFVTKLGPSGTSLIYSTYLGGSNFDLGEGIAVDTAGDAYITGATYSNDFPIQSALQTTLVGLSNAYVTKLSPSGASLLYSTYLGGSNNYAGAAIAVD